MDSISVQQIGSMGRYEAEAQIRARVQTVPMGDNLVLARVLGHPKMFLHTQDLGFSAHVMMDGYWEIWLTQTLIRLISPGMVVIDVGANFGYYTILAAQCAWPNGKVIAVEPNPPVAAVLEKTLVLNGFSNIVRLERVAAGAVDDGFCHLFVPDHEPKNATVVAEGAVISGGQTVAVPVRTIDSLCRDLGRVDVVKIDAEGAEIDVIAGMAQTIARFKPVIALEFNAARYADGANFLARLTAIYGAPKLIDFEGEAQKVSQNDILFQNIQEDKLLLFGTGS